MAVEELVDMVRDERERLNFLLDLLYSDKLDMIDPGGMYSTRNLELMNWNALLMKHIKRYNGNPYFQHNLSSAFLLNNLPGGASEKEVSYLMIHELVDVNSDFYPDFFIKYANELGGGWDDELRASVLLSGIDSFSSSIDCKLAGLMMVRDYGSSSHMRACISEKLDSALDLDFLKGRQRDSAIECYFLALPIFGLYLFENHLDPEFIDVCRDIVDFVSEEEQVSMKKAKKYFQSFLINYKKNKQEYREAINTHLEDFSIDRQRVFHF